MISIKANFILKVLFYMYLLFFVQLPNTTYVVQ